MKHEVRKMEVPLTYPAGYLLAPLGMTINLRSSVAASSERGSRPLVPASGASAELITVPFLCSWGESWGSFQTPKSSEMRKAHSLVNSKATLTSRLKIHSCLSFPISYFDQSMLSKVIHQSLSSGMIYHTHILII